MQEFDLYLNPQKSSVGLYVHKGAGLPDLVDSKEWVFDGTASQADLPPDIVKKITSFSHTEMNRPEIVDPRNILRRVRMGLDVFARGGADCHRVEENADVPAAADVVR